MGQNKPPFKDKRFTDKYGNFIKAWKWYDKDGNWIFCTVRYEKNNKKNIIPFTLKNNEWIPKQFIEKKRPIMDLHIIIKDKKKPVLLVEGEKCYDAAKKMLSDNFIPTTWTSGTHAVSKTDFSPLKNRPVHYWFDHDDPGYETIDFFREKLNKLILVQPPIDSPVGWDIADAVKEGWDADELFIFISQFNKIEEKPEKKKKQKKLFLDEIEYPFEILGYNQGYMFFLPHETGQIYKIKKGALNNQHLIELAPLEFWTLYYGIETKRGVSISWIDAQDQLIREVNKKNPFSFNNIRGRGTWKEKESIIIHTGKNLILNGDIIDVKDYSPNGHVYERLPELKLSITDDTLSDSELFSIIDCFRQLSIENKLERNFLVGWCVLAPFCGALDWRPHIWITGPAGSGKSAVIRMIIHKMLGEFMFCPEGDSSGAGIIQGLKNDSLPVVHDEIDRTSLNIQNLEVELSITRSSSSATEKTALYKGTADQIGKKYIYNSMFCFSSINVYLNKKSDKSRFSIINLSKNLMIPWSDFKQQIQKTFTRSICDKIRARTYHNFDVIKENILLFKQEVGQYLGDQRLGDQIGTLLAGAASLMNLKKYNKNDIEKLCDKNIKGYIDEDEALTDEKECLIKIFTSRIKYVGHERAEDTTLLELLHRTAGDIETSTDIRAAKELYKYGIKYDSKRRKVYLAVNHNWIKELLKNTPWKFAYAKILKRLSFVNKEINVQYFGPYFTGRAISMKADYLFRLSDDNVYMEAGF